MSYETGSTGQPPVQKRSKGPMGRIFGILLPFLVLAVGVGGFVLMGMNKKPGKREETPIAALPVLAEAPRSETMKLTVITQGEVSPRTEIDVVPQVGGKIDYISPNFVDGGFFHKGDLLIRVEQTDYKLGVVQAEAQVAQAQQVLEQEQAEAQLAAKDWEELGQGEASALTLRKPQLTKARAALAAAQAMLADAKLALKRTEIRAPFTGRVRSKAADYGQYVTPGARLGRIFSTSVVDVRVPLTDADLAKLGLPLAFTESKAHPGPDVTLSAIVGGKQRDWQGHITRTDSAIDPKTRQLYAFAEVNDPYGKGSDDGMPLAVGLFVQAKIEGREVDNALVIPRSALRGDNKVFLVKDDTLDIVTVNVASSDRNHAIVTAGLNLDDKVITSPVRGAASGMKIRTVTRMAEADTKAAENPAVTETENGGE